MRDQSSVSSTMLPASQSNLWLSMKSNWTWPWHRPACKSKWANQQPLQTQTPQGCPTACMCPKEKKRWEAWGSRGTCIFYLFVTAEQHFSGIQDTKSSLVEGAVVSDQGMSVPKDTILGSVATMDHYQPSVLVTHDYPWGERSRWMKGNTALASF